MADILLNFPTNIGDTVLALPALDRVYFNYPGYKITAIASVYTKELLLRNSFIDEVIIFNKFWKIREKIKFSFFLRNKFDIFVDFKNSFLPVIVNPKKRTPFYRKFSNKLHAKDRYLYIIKKIAPQETDIKSDFILTNEEKKVWKNYCFEKSIFIACSSRFSLKNYPLNYLKEVVDVLIKRYPIIILGDEASRSYYKDLLFKDKIIDLVGKTKLYDVFYILKNYAKLLFCVDCSILHIGSYLNLPIVAIFGPTDSSIYGPWSENFIVLKNHNLNYIDNKKNISTLSNKYMEIPPKLVIDAIEKLIIK